MQETGLLKRATWTVWFCVVTTIGIVGWISSARAQKESQVPEKILGVVVENVGEGSALEKAGLRTGDEVFAWERMPAPPANPQRAQGAIASVFDWMGLEIEQAPRGIVKLTGQRGGEARFLEIGPGEWKATIRPKMPERMLQDYINGKELIEAKKIEEGMRFWRSIVGDAEKETVDVRLRCWLLLRIGDVWSMEGQWENAHGAYRFALETAYDPRSRVAIWQAIGDAFEKANDFEKAREAYSSAQEIREGSWGESLALARGMHYLGRLDWWQTRLDSLQVYWQGALEIRRKLAPGSLALASSLNNLGGLAYRRGDLHRTAEYYEESLEIRKRIGQDSLDIAASLHNLGILYYARGDLDLAEVYYNEALEIQQELAPDSLDVAWSLNNLGNLVYRRGDLDLAAEFYEASLGLKQKLAPGGLALAGVLTNLGMLASESGSLDRAAEYFEMAMTIQQRLAPEGLDVAWGLEDLGSLAAERGQFEQATKYHREALAIRRKLSPGSIDVAISLHSLATLASSLGNLDRAADYFDQALRIEQRLAPGTSIEAATLHGLATLRRKQNQPELALELFHQALQAVESQVTTLGGSRDLKADFRAERRSYYRDTIALLLELRQPAEAFHILERSRARSFLAQLAERDLVFFDAPEDLERQRRHLARSYDRTQDEIAQLNTLEQAAEIEARLTRLRQLRREYEDITEKIVKASPRQRALRFPEPLGLDAARQALDPGTVMLSYSVGDDETHLFVLTQDNGLVVKTLPVGREELRVEVGRVLELQKRRSSALLYTEPLRQVGDRLYHALILPAEESIGRSERVLIVPDGPLHLLPFALLVRKAGPGDGDRGRYFQYLVEWKPLHSVLSATVYAELKSQRRRTPNEDAGVLLLAAFGDPQYLGGTSSADRIGDRSVDVYVRAAGERGFDFRPLPYSREEVDRITALYPEGTVRAFLGAEALEERAKSLGNSARILHFATHGRFDDRIPLNSYLALTIPEEFRRDQDNGLLQAWEIFEEVRLDADLVVLSACESGVGAEVDGEGLKGLTRAFQFAGARTVASSLWQVDDQSTAELMQRLYRHLREGMSKDEALRAAQLELIRGPIEVRNRRGQVEERDLSSPYHWAAFQLIGDWR